MLIMQAQELEEGARIWHNLANQSVVFLAGPWQNTNEPIWYVTVCDWDGKISLVNISDLHVEKPEPKVGDVWRKDGVRAYVVEVGDKYVVYKKNPLDGDSAVVARVKDDFTNFFNRIS